MRSSDGSIIVASWDGIAAIVASWAGIAAIVASWAGIAAIVASWAGMAAIVASWAGMAAIVASWAGIAACVIATDPAARAAPRATANSGSSGTATGKADVARSSSATAETSEDLPIR
ncbi:hypothetical protein I552_6937 [Mycobacterium xenopi 3993]|nr:hypothetical protein I552_6937 [Mycobacterium xenopi 3993]